MIAGIIGITPERIAPHAVTNSQYRENRALTPSPVVPPKSLKAAESRILTVVSILRTVVSILTTKQKPPAEYWKLNTEMISIEINACLK